jgi:hypothetical protein
VQSGPAKFGTISIPGDLSGSGFMLGMEAVKVDLADITYNRETLQVYPNPAHDAVNIRISNKNTAASIYNLQGELVKTLYLQEGTNSIPVSDLKSGLYLLNVTDGFGKRVVKLQVE